MISKHLLLLDVHNDSYPVFGYDTKIKKKNKKLFTPNGLIFSLNRNLN